MANTSAMKRGFHYDVENSRLALYVDGTEVARFHATNGASIVVDAFDLAGQTITTVNASGSTVMATWVAAFNGANGADDESPKFALALKVDGTTYYVPAFTSAT